MDSLAEAAKLIPNGIICLSSALAFHDLTDRIPPYVWVAIGPRGVAAKGDAAACRHHALWPQDIQSGG